MISSFFKTSRNKRFNFTPRYYDETKEALKERYAQMEAEVSGKSTLGSGGFNHNLKDRWRANKKTSNFSKKSNFRLVIIASLLFIIAYYLLYF